MREIPLSRGMKALVDDEDYASLVAFKWHALRVKKPAGREKFYAARTDHHSHRMILMHRDIMGCSDGFKVDHIRPDNTLDNRRLNLRVCSAAQNSWNQRKRPGKSSSRFKGVSFCKNTSSWSVEIMVNGFRRRTLHVVREEDAATIYNFWASEMQGEYALYNQASA